MSLVFKKRIVVLSVLFAIFCVSAAFAQDTPPCMDGGQALSINNDQVLEWKKTTANQFLARAYVEGKVTHVTLDRQSHYQYEIQIGPQSTDTLEVIYNKEFGATPTAVPGMDVLACGDYITSTSQAGHYPPSPSGAIIHWVHENTRGGGHPNGFMIMGGALCGFSPTGDARDSGNSILSFFNFLNGLDGTNHESASGAPQLSN